MDYDFWLRMASKSPPLILPCLTSQFRLHHQSKSGTQTRTRFREQYQVACRYFHGDLLSRLIHRLHVEKTVWAYRLMRLVGR
jgi:hypothetical protein